MYFQKELFSRLIYFPVFFDVNYFSNYDCGKFCLEFHTSLTRRLTVNLFLFIVRIVVVIPHLHYGATKYAANKTFADIYFLMNNTCHVSKHTGICCKRKSKVQGLLREVGPVTWKF